jgi:hypothetical protein
VIAVATLAEYARAVTFIVTVAVIGGWLPEWEPPINSQGFDVKYADRMKVSLAVEDEETLESVYRRAIQEFQPKPLPHLDGTVSNPINTVFWVMFYEPTDDDPARHKVYETPSDLVIVGRDGLARWDLDRGAIPYGDIIRSGEYGLIRGDPLRPYLYLQLPQGAGWLDIAWEPMLHAWEVLEGLYVTGQTAVLLNNVRKRLTGRHVLAAKANELQARGGRPMAVLRTLQATPWAVEDLRSIMGLETNDEAARLLDLAGCTLEADGHYRFSTDTEETNFLAMAHDDVFRLVLAGLMGDDELLRARFEEILRTGEPPSFPIGSSREEG